jgi:hypothetical protein
MEQLLSQVPLTRAVSAKCRTAHADKWNLTVKDDGVGSHLSFTKDMRYGHARMAGTSARARA